MQRQSRAEDSRHNDLVAYHLHRSLAQRRLDDAGFVVERLRDLVTHHLADSLDVAAKTHRILLHMFVADLRDKFVENRILLVKNMNHRFISFRPMYSVLSARPARGGSFRPRP